MDNFDLIVIGSGAGMNVVSNAVNSGMNVAIVERYLMGGTCLNYGCIPSKILLYPADVIRALNDAHPLGIKGSINNIDFPFIMKRMRSFIDHDRIAMERGIAGSDRLTWYKDTGEFIGDYTMKTGKKKITAPKIVIASGARQIIPAIPGLKETGYIDNISVFNLKNQPKSIILLGGGYISCEFGHFFSALGTNVTIVGRNPRLLKNEEPEISEIVKKRFSKYAAIYTGYEAVEVKKEGHQKAVFAKNQANGKVYKFKADEILVAIGRRSNSDLLKPQNTGVETDSHGWIKVNEYLETTKLGIWAMGDATGYHMFRHTANYEASLVWRNGFTDHKESTDYHAVPHAVFGYPQVASVGMTQAEAKAAGYKILVGKAKYTDVAKGFAMGEEESLVKVIVDGESRRILGAHIVGTDASDLVQQVVYLMNTDDQDYMLMARAQVIHPALSEVVITAFANMQSPDHVHGHAHAHQHSHEHQH
jgi:dihydrolipoamide dehydrogenase